MKEMIVLISRFFIHFSVFWLKIGCSCLFVIILQLQIGQKSLEHWIEVKLKQSVVSQYLQQTAVAGVDVLNQQFPHLKGLAQNKIVQRDSIMELHSGLIRTLEKSFGDFNGDAEALGDDFILEDGEFNAGNNGENSGKEDNKDRALERQRHPAHSSEK